MTVSDSTTESTDRGGWFTTTHWSVVLSAGGGNSPDAQRALEQLCKTYWYPVYAYIRRNWNKPPEDAKDLTQEFFAGLLAKGSLKFADPGRGRFRSFLLASVKNMLCNLSDRTMTIKRGSGQNPISFEAMTAEQRYGNEPAELVAENLYDRAWAAMIKERALARLRQEYAAQNTDIARLFPKFEPHLMDSDAPKLYPLWAAELNIKLGSIPVCVLRIRKRLREVLRDEVAQTLSNPTEAELVEELRGLKAAWFNCDDSSRPV
jgi:RNA polymerase sigma-70 factor (ECF subfamily)